MQPNRSFLGFEQPSPQFEELWYRLQVLERWRELAILPATVEECHPDDRFLLPANRGQTKKKKTTMTTEEANHVCDGTNFLKTQEDHDDDDKSSGSATSTVMLGMDDVIALQNQCLKVRQYMNDMMTTMAIETTEWDEYLVIQTSQIPNAGLGLYYIPSSSSTPGGTSTTPSSSTPPPRSALQSSSLSPSLSSSSRKEGTSSVGGGGIAIPPNTVVCYYTGHIHSHFSSRVVLVDPTDRAYLLWIHGDTLVDPKTLLYVKARYVNDPLNDECVNCKFVPQKVNGVDVRAAVVTTRPICPGEELYISYGDWYWDQQPTKGTRFVNHRGQGFTRRLDVDE